MSNVKCPMSNDLILSLETATRGGSLALMRGESLIASSTGVADESHSVNLLSRIETLLDEAHINLRDIDLFAVASGPGSFTGLRIGLATMKAFAAVFNRPCIGVPTLEAIGCAAGASECTYALLPAGRGEVFAQRFAGNAGVPPAAGTAGVPPATGTAGVSLATGSAGVSPAPSADRRADLGMDSTTDVALSLRARSGRDARGPSEELEPFPAEHIPPRVLLERINEVNSIHWAGPGAHLYKDLLRERAAALGIKFVEEQLNANAHNGRTPSVSAGGDICHLTFDDGHLTFDGESSAVDRKEIQWTLAPNEEQLAVFVAILALQRANDPVAHRAEDLRAIYVRPSDAELHK